MLTPPRDSDTDGWDQLDDYQLGKDLVERGDAATRRIVAPAEPERPPPILRPDEESSSTFARRGTGLPFWRGDGSAEQDAEVMARIMAREAALDAEARTAAERSRSAAERDALERRDLLRERQRREVEAHLALRRNPQPGETALQRALREAADAFLALGICPDHLEWLPDLGRFCSWGGRLYDHGQVFALQDQRGQPFYALGPSPEGPATACYSPRERRWRLNQPVAPAENLVPVERLLPVPRRHADGTPRYSAQRPGTLLMEEGVVPVYIVRNAVYTIAHLRAAHHLFAGTSPLDAVAAGGEAAARAAEDAVGLAGRMAGAIGDAADRVTDVLAKTTRLFRRK